MSHLALVSLKGTPKEHLIRIAFDDFILSRKAALVSPRTVEFYEYTVPRFIDDLDAAGVNKPAEITAAHVRRFLAALASRGLSDASVHAFARGIKAFLRFLLREGYADGPVEFKMPRRVAKRLPQVLTPEQITQLLDACLTCRDRALLLLLLDTGLRRAEAIALNWEDVDLSSGLVRIRRGKGGKARSVAVGLRTRRELLRYRRTVSHSPSDSLIQTRTGTRLKPAGLRQALRRISERSGVHFSAHTCRRTFATLSLRGGLGEIYLQALMGHSTLEMTRQYIRLVDDDLLAAHQAHGPVDNFLR